MDAGVGVGVGVFDGTGVGVDAGIGGGGGCGQSSVRNGTAGRPALFTRLTSGFCAQPYRIAIGFGTDGELTSIDGSAAGAAVFAPFLSFPDFGNERVPV